MDINLWRGVFSALLLVIFAGIVWYTWSRHKRKDFEDAGRIPLRDSDES